MWNLQGKYTEGGLFSEVGDIMCLLLTFAHNSEMNLLFFFFLITGKYKNIFSSL